MTSGERLRTSLDWVAIREEVMRGVLLCVQYFVRDPAFSQRNFFSWTGVTMLFESAALSDSIISSSVYALWSEGESESSDQGIEDLKTCFEKPLNRRPVVEIRANNGMLWVLCGHHLVKLPHKTVSAYQQLWKRGSLNICPLLLRHVKLLIRADIILLQEKEKSNCPGDQLSCRVRLKFQVPLPLVRNVLRTKISLSLLLWHLRFPVENLGQVGEIGK